MQNLLALTSYSFYNNQTCDEEGRKSHTTSKENDQNLFELLFSCVLEQNVMKISRRRILNTIHFQLQVLLL